MLLLISLDAQSTYVNGHFRDNFRFWTPVSLTKVADLRRCGNPGIRGNQKVDVAVARLVSTQGVAAIASAAAS